MAAKIRDVLRLFTTEGAFIGASKKRQMGYDKSTGRLLMHNNTDDTLAGAWSKDSLQVLKAGAQTITGVKTHDANLIMGANADIILSTTSDVNVGSGNFTIAGASGNTLIGGNATIGQGGAGVDYTLTFDGESSDGVITWMEDEAQFLFDSRMHVQTGDVSVTANTAADEGVFESSEAGGISILTPDANLGSLFIGSPSENTGGFFQWQYSTGLMHIGTQKAAAAIKIYSGAAELAIDIDGAQISTFSASPVIGIGAAGVDYTLTFDGETNDGVLTWMEDEDHFKFSDDVLISGAEKLFFDQDAASQGGWINHDGTDLTIRQNRDDGTGEMRLDVACGDFVVMENSVERMKYTSASADWKVTGELEIEVPDAVGTPVLKLTQSDISEEMIEFASTIGVGNAIEAIAAKTLTTTHFIKVTLPGPLTTYIPAGTIA